VQQQKKGTFLAVGTGRGKKKNYRGKGFNVGKGLGGKFAQNNDGDRLLWVCVTTSSIERGRGMRWAEAVSRGGGGGWGGGKKTEVGSRIKKYKRPTRKKRH